MKVYIEAYDANNKQILGNLDGQGVINAKQFRRTMHFKSLSTFSTLNNKVKYYDIVTVNDVLLATVQNTTFIGE